MKMNEKEIVHRRAELLTQQFLLDLGAVYVADPGPDLGVDYLASFRSENGETKIIGVEIKVSVNFQHEQVRISQDQLIRMSRMNIPVLIIAVDPKFGTFHVAWAREAAEHEIHGAGKDITVHLQTVDQERFPELKERILAA